MKNNLEYEISDQNEEKEKNQLLYERFLQLIQKILLNAGAAKEVALTIMKTVDSKYTIDQAIEQASDIMDYHIENYLKNLITEVKMNSKIAEQKLFTILNRRFSCSVFNKIAKDNIKMSQQDAVDIVQNALMTVLLKCRSVKPIKAKGTMIQWTQAILKNKFGDYRRSLKRKLKRLDSLSVQDYEPIYLIKLSDVASKRKQEKGVNPQHVELSNNNPSDDDPFEIDPYSWQPGNFETKDQKKRLLKLVKKMDDRCKKVFTALFSKADVQAVHKQFPELTRKQIDVIISRCRSKLKTAAIKGRILE